jgi:HPt (histidine-containing phosphotransfer) domain-containing protein
MKQNDESKINALLESLWKRGLPLVRERLDLLERASASANAGELSEEVRIEAVEAAHKFSGSLGMFGFDRGTEIARQIEQILSASPVASSRFAALVRDLRETLPLA